MTASGDQRAVQLACLPAPGSLRYGCVLACEMLCLCLDMKGWQPKPLSSHKPCFQDHRRCIQILG